MTIRLGVVMDPLNTINPKKDSTFAMMLAAKAKHWEINYFVLDDLFLLNGLPYGHTKVIDIFDDGHYQIKSKQTIPLSDLNVILMRKDPPVNEKYLYATQILEQAERLGTLVANRPQALRDANEKLITAYFPQCCPPTLVTSSIQQLHLFWQEHQDIVCKPLDGMGGTAIFRLQAKHTNAKVIFEMLTRDGSTYIMAQQYIPEITAGDKRILLIDGEPVPYALARIPQGNDWRGNLAVGAKGEARPLTKRDLWVCEQVKPMLKERGLIFVGIDVIGDYLTEINITSPTCIRELDQAKDLNIAGLLLETIEKKL